LWLFLDLVGEEEGGKGGQVVGEEVLDEIFDFFVGGDEKGGLAEVRGVFLHVDNGKIAALLVSGEPG